MGNDTEPRTYRFDAFISYRHVEPDRAWAKWLHGALETYRVPKALVAKGLPKRLTRVFRDEEELPANADLSSEITAALDDSKFLIVICSPRAPLSKWVNAEVEYFRKLGRHDKVLALLIEGEPRDAFPPALTAIRKLVTDAASGTSREVIEEVEPLAADARPERTDVKPRMLRSHARLRLLACILGCRFDDLRQRDAERRMAWAQQLGAGLVALIVLLSGLTAWAFQQRSEANYQAGLARSAATVANKRGEVALQAFSEVVGVVGSEGTGLGGDQEERASKILLITQSGFEEIERTMLREAVSPELVEIRRQRGDMLNLAGDLPNARASYKEGLQFAAQLAGVRTPRHLRELATIYTRLADLNLRVSLKTTIYGFDEFSWRQWSFEGETDMWFGPTIVGALGDGNPSSTVGFSRSRLSEANEYLKLATNACELAVSVSRDNRTKLDLSFVVTKRADVLYFMNQPDEADSLVQRALDILSELDQSSDAYERLALESKNHTLRGWMAGSLRREMSAAKTAFEKARIAAEAFAALRESPSADRLRIARKEAGLASILRPRDDTAAKEDNIFASLARTDPSDQEVAANAVVARLEREAFEFNRAWRESHRHIFFGQPAYYWGHGWLGATLAKAINPRPNTISFGWWFGPPPTTDSIRATAPWHEASAWDQLTKQMPTAKVKSLLGEPTSKRTKANGGGSVWLYEAKNFGRGEVHFDGAGELSVSSRPYLLR